MRSCLRCVPCLQTTFGDARAESEAHCTAPSETQLYLITYSVLLAGTGAKNGQWYTRTKRTKPTIVTLRSDGIRKTQLLTRICGCDRSLSRGALARAYHYRHRFPNLPPCCYAASFLPIHVPLLHVSTKSELDPVIQPATKRFTTLPHPRTWCGVR
jgi:hypothetical protein